MVRTLCDEITCFHDDGNQHGVKVVIRKELKRSPCGSDAWLRADDRRSHRPTRSTMTGATGGGTGGGVGRAAPDGRAGA